MSKGLLIVVSAPSGCGKGTILAQVLKMIISTIPYPLPPVPPERARLTV